MTKIHTYFVVERGTVGDGNWSALLSLFDAMGEHGTPFPMYNNHTRTRLDGDAVIYESNFDTTEVSIEAFKELLAGEFEVQVGDIDDTPSQADYAGIGTTVWDFLYAAVSRFIIRRLGGSGATWNESRLETIGYLKLNQAEWEEV